ncbi:hypothetical protein ACPUEN_11765 [Algoriphagus yeomjeoni]|uniref:hypothetical protein n=1 Tax=Algoriphagus yeomjeoni TaxID=291403 RepID=UPI003CE56F84
MSVNLSGEVINKNKLLVEAFHNMKECIKRIQYWLEEEWLRVNVISDFSKDDRAKYILDQVGTSFCVISLGTCDEGEYSIALSIDSQINEKIGYYFASILLRRLFEFTPESCANNVRIMNFSKDCDDYLTKVLDEKEKGVGCHSVSVTPFEG